MLSLGLGSPGKSNRMSLNLSTEITMDEVREYAKANGYSRANDECAHNVAFLKLQAEDQIPAGWDPQNIEIRFLPGDRMRVEFQGEIVKYKLRPVVKRGVKMSRFARAGGPAKKRPKRNRICFVQSATSFFVAPGS